jgi:hypothetical protein
VFATEAAKAIEISLKHHSTIRRFISFFLLIVLAISVVPKAYFHDVIANHTDTVQVCTDNTRSVHLHQNGMNCHFDQLVVTSLYHFSPDPINEASALPFNSYHSNPGPVFFFQPLTTRDSRGPPSEFKI